MQYHQCRSCGARIIWIHSAAGNLMPLDAEPVENGNLCIIDGKAHAIKNDLFDPMLPQGPRYQSHFATCSSPELHRKKKENK